jgi:hypothetical protein
VFATLHPFLHPTGPILVKNAKPDPEFPLFLHQTGQWAKKVRGRMYDFGVDADVALAKWLKDKDYLFAGRAVPRHPDGITVRELVNGFLISKKSLLNSGELSSRTWRGYFTTGKMLVEAFGKERQVDDLAGKDFEQLRAKFAKTRGPVSWATRFSGCGRCSGSRSRMGWSTIR